MNSLKQSAIILAESMARVDYKKCHTDYQKAKFRRGDFNKYPIGTIEHDAYNNVIEEIKGGH